MSSAVAIGAGPYVNRFAPFIAEREKSEPDWLVRRRKDAMQRFATHGFPTTREEDWKYTSLAAVAGREFAPAAGDLTEAEIAPLRLASAGTCLVMVNGRFRPDLSTEAEAGVRIAGLETLLAAGAPAGPEHLEDEARPSHSLAALNQALFEDTLHLQVDGGVLGKKPLHILHVTRSAQGASVCHPRIEVHAGPGSDIHLVEQYVTLAGEPTFTNAVTEIRLEPGAIVRHEKLQEAIAGSSHVGVLRVHQERDSNFNSLTVTSGEGLVRNDVADRLAGEGADSTLNGLYVMQGSGHVDNQTFVDHAHPNCTSRELYKGILDGHSRGVFRGRVLVRSGAQKTNAWQSNKNLLLSPDALADSIPQLEIHADDVQCRHGSTIGQLDPDMLFYLRSRGISADAAREVLTYAFGAEVLRQMRVAELRRRISSRLFPAAADNEQESAP